MAQVMDVVGLTDDMGDGCCGTEMTRVMDVVGLTDDTGDGCCGTDR